MLLGIDIGGTKCMFGCQLLNKKRIFKRYQTGIKFTDNKFIEILINFISYCSSNHKISLLNNINYIVISLCDIVDKNGVIEYLTAISINIGYTNMVYTI